MDEDVVEIRNVENVCRLCLSTDGPRSSVFAAYEQEGSAVPLATKIQVCLSIQISTTDKLSTLICENCVKCVNQWHSYKESCLRSQDKLQGWLTNQLKSKPMIVAIKDEPIDINEHNTEVTLESTNDSDPLVKENETDNEPAQEVIDDNNSEIGEISNDDNDNDNDITDINKDSETTPSTEDNEKDENQIDTDIVPLCSIKSEPQDDYDTDGTVEVESMNDNELLLNPMAVGEKEDTIMEADSTQKSNAVGAPQKKKLRRGPHTHFRAPRAFKQKCVHCQIFLHSKYTYIRHMKRFHNKNSKIQNLINEEEEEEEIVEDLEDELVSMEKNSPLTEVQEEIISQLKTFCCYSCNQNFNDRRSTLSHIRQHLPDLQPYTCIACLTKFPGRSMYQLHCGSSFECAMKIALVVPKHGEERYFTCNMCLRSMNGRKELLSHLSGHSDRQYEEMMSPARSPPKLKPMTPLPSAKNNESDNVERAVPAGPYKNGNPAHNHKCDLCGMIYRYRPNMIKHKHLCMRLQPEMRVSYKCVHCFMTYLVFKKFHSHVTVYHKKKDFICSVCNSKFRSPSDYLTHYETHRHSSKKSQNTAQNERNEANSSKTKTDGLKYSCGFCSQEFSTRTELTEHQNLHLKMKIYPCAICRSMFSSAATLELHMKDHEIEDPKEQHVNASCVEYGSLDGDVKVEREESMNTSTVSDPGAQSYECNQCGKILSNDSNLKRHITIAHRNAKYNCTECSRIFSRRELYVQHMQFQHKSSKTANMFQCPQCPKSFVFQTNFDYHYRTAHLEKPQNGYSCDICGKTFVEEASLKIHKGWHNRVNSRLSTRFILGKQQSSNSAAKDSTTLELGENTERPAKARKSFPNPPSDSPARSSSGSFQCQVCNDQFNDVKELRSHLWDVHCARNKPEKNFSNNELQCELCTNIFPDRETLSSHMRWHKANPILNDGRKAFNCDICGKSYSSKKVLWKHKRLHKATVAASFKFHSLTRKPTTNQFLCTICRKIFASSQSLQRHKFSFHNDSQNQNRAQQLYNSNRRISHEDEPRAKRPRLEIDDNATKLSPFAMDFAGERRKPVMCHLCKKMFANMSVLYKHKQNVHKPRKDVTPEFKPASTQGGNYVCNVCSKEFPALPNLRQHFTIKHKRPEYQCNVSSCNLMFDTSDSLKNHEQEHTNMMFCCKLCNLYYFHKAFIMHHITNRHNTVYQDDSKTFHREIDLNAYVVRGAIGTMCPQCNVKYPNNRALKIHYVKVHENAD